MDTFPFGREVAKITGDDELGCRGKRAIEELVVVRIGAGGAGLGGLDAVGGFNNRVDESFKTLAVFRELLPPGHVAVFGFERVRNTNGQARQSHDSRLVPAGLPAGRDKDIGIEDNAHGKIEIG